MKKTKSYRRSTSQRIALACGIFTLVILVILGGLSLWLLAGTNPSDRPVRAAGQPISGSRDGVPEDQRTILLLGVDGDGSAVTAQRSDMILLNRIVDGRMDSVSIPRDLLVEMPKCTGQGGVQKINAIYSYSSAIAGVQAGARCLAQEISNLSGVPIDDYVVINMNSVVNLVNEVGGIEICLDQREVEERLAPGITTPGCHNLNGEQAFRYGQARKYVDDGSDLSRINRQHQILSALVSKVKSMNSVGDLPTMLSLAKKVSDNTESNLGLSDARTVIQLSRTVVNLSLPPAVTLPVDPAGDGANLVLSPDSKLFFESLRSGAKLPN